MSNNRYNPSALKVTGIKEALDNRRLRDNATFCYREYGSYYYVKGQIVTVEEFERMFPIELKPYLPKGCNADRTKNFIHNKKSY